MGGRDTLRNDCEDVFPVLEEDFDKYPWLVCAENAIINLKNRQAFPISYKFMLTRYARVIYDPSATSSVLSKAVNEIFADVEERKYFFRILGVSLVGVNIEAMVPIFYGPETRNGKSVLVNALSEVLGCENGYSANVSIRTISKASNNRSGSAPSNDLYRLHGTRVAFINEPEKNFCVNSALLKTISGSDKITARPLYGNDIQFEAGFIPIIVTNHLPEFDDKTLVLSDRLKLVPFRRHFLPHEQDKSLGQKLKSNEAKSALFNMILDGVSDYQNVGLAEPASVTEEMEKCFAKDGLLNEYIAEKFDKKPGSLIQWKEFYESFTAWCNSNAYEVYPKTYCKILMEEKGYVTGKAHKMEVNGKLQLVHNVVEGLEYKAVSSDSGNIIPFEANASGGSSIEDLFADIKPAQKNIGQIQNSNRNGNNDYYSSTQENSSIKPSFEQIKKIINEGGIYNA